MKKAVVNSGKQNILNLLLMIVFSVSFSILAFYQIVQYKPISIIITVAASFFIGIIFFKKTSADVLETVKGRLWGLKSALSLAAAGIIAIAMYEKSHPELDESLPSALNKVFSLPFWVLVVPALFYLTIWIVKKVASLLRDLYMTADRTDKVIYIVVTVVSLAVISALYFLSSEWYMQYDLVYSMDSGWCYTHIFSKFAYRDIRHPIISVVTFPIWAIIYYTLKFIAPSQIFGTLCAVCFQMVNVQALILSGFMIGKLAKSRWVTLLWFASAPVMLFTVFFEKYQVCIFFLVLYAYQLCNKGKYRESSFVLAVGSMPTSVFLLPACLFTKEPLKDKLKSLVKTAVYGVSLLISTGRPYLLNPFEVHKETSAQAHKFGLQGLPIAACLFSFINMIHGAFLFLPSSVNEDGVYLWNGVTESFSIVGVVLLAVIILGLVVNIKDLFVKICGVWLACAVVLFIGFQWSIVEGPLFSLYFSWALIPLFQKGIQYFIDRFKLNEKLVYGLIIVPVFTINVMSMLDIISYIISTLGA